MKFTFSPESRPLEGFTIKRAIYRGGFGEVYYAQSDAGREVALKLLQNNADIELRGVQQCLNLSHPNLVTIFDVRQDGDGDHWIVMEYVSGATLDTVLKKSPNGLPVETVRKWLQGMTSGLTYLHSRGLVHRDMKPANVFMEDGIVKIGDVGLSKFISPSRHSAQTQSVGTVHYMAPEVAKGKYGREVDVYAMGIILYEMLTGELPFDGESTGEILMKHLSEEPDLEKLPPRLKNVVGKALKKDPKDRFSRVEALHRAFEDAILGIHSGSEDLQKSPILTETFVLDSDQSLGEEEAGAQQPAKPVGTDNRKSTQDSSNRPLIGLIILGLGLLFYITTETTWSMVLGAVGLGIFLTWKKNQKIESKPVVQQATLKTPKKFPTVVSQTSHTLGALFIAVPITAVLTICLAVMKPTMFGNSSSLSTINPALIGLFSAVTVLSSWGILLLPYVSGGYQKGKRISSINYALMGGLVGLVGYGLQNFLMVEWMKAPSDGMFTRVGDHPLVVGSLPSVGGYIAFFATFFGFRNWQEMLSPFRNHRLSVVSVLFTVFVAWLATAIFSFPNEMAIAWGVMIACVTQLSAPMDVRPGLRRRAQRVA